MFKRKNPMRLIEKAKNSVVERRKNWDLNEEVIELALAWLKDEVGYAQCCRVLQMKKGGNSIYKIARALREAYRQGRLKIK